MKYSLKSIVLKNCPYSNALVETLKNNNIKANIITVTYENKDKYKTKYISTFPQLYLMKKNTNNKLNEILLIGGYTETKKILDIINDTSELDISQRINIIKEKLQLLYPNTNNKNILRLIKLLK